MEGDKVKISIPLANVLDVEMNTMAFAEAIQVKVMESDESFAVDEVCTFCGYGFNLLLDFSVVCHSPCGNLFR